MAHGQGTLQFSRPSFASQGQQRSASTSFPTHLPLAVPPISMGVPLQNSTLHPPPLPSPPLPQHQSNQQNSLTQPNPTTQSNLPSPPQSHPTNISPQTHTSTGQSHITHNTHNSQHASDQNTNQHTQTVPTSQQHQYPGINSIPGMNSMSPLGGLSGSSAANVGLQALHGMNGFHNFPPSFPNASGIQGYPSMPGMQSLINPPSEVPGHHPMHHTSSTIPSSQHISTTSSLHQSGLLGGGIEKRRKARKPIGLLRTMLPTDDPHLLEAQHVAHGVPVGMTSADTSSLLHSAHHHSNLPEVDGIQFKYVEQLPEGKIKRLREEKIKPIEELTFEDIKAYNRNQLRAYCFVYGIKRRKKAEMELNMARYAAAFHPNDPNFDINKFETTKYIDGAIPRRQVPVTKEQKERAAGNPRRLTNAIQQRPQVLSFGHHSYHTSSHGGGHLGLPPGASHQPPPLPSHTSSFAHHFPTSSAPRIHDLSTNHGQNHGHHHLSNGPSHHQEEHDVVVVANEVLSSVPEPLNVQNQLLSMTHQIGEE